MVFSVYCQPGAHCRRDPNEDTYAHFKLGKLQVYAVFDGHGGHQAATLCADKVEEILTSFADQEMSVALQKTFLALDKAANEDPQKPQCCGTTGVIVVLDADKGWVANAGDSEAILVHKDHHVILTTRHQASNDLEAKRAQALNAKISLQNMLNTKKLHLQVPDIGEIKIEVTRSLGHGNCEPQGALIPDPYIAEFEINDALAIIIGSDGLFADRNGDLYSKISERLVQGSQLNLDLDRLVNFIGKSVQTADDTTGIIHTFENYHQGVKNFTCSRALKELESNFAGYIWYNYSLDDAKKYLHNKGRSLIRTKDNYIYVDSIDKYAWDRNVVDSAIYCAIKNDEFVWIHYRDESNDLKQLFSDSKFLRFGEEEELEDSDSD